MPTPCLNLLVSNETRLFVSAFTASSNYLTLVSTVLPGDTQLTVEPIAAPLAPGEQIVFTEGVQQKRIIGYAINRMSKSIGSTLIDVEPVDFTAIPGDTGTYLGLIEIYGVETASFQSSTQANAVTLLGSGGWISKSSSVAEWNFQFTGYIPTGIHGQSYERIKDLFFSRKPLYLERRLGNGETKAGKVIASSFSDQVQGAGYVQYSVSFEGSEVPTLNILEVRTQPPVVLPIGDGANSFDYSSDDNSPYFIFI